jgi:hypothetical protein
VSLLRILSLKLVILFVSLSEGVASPGEVDDSFRVDPDILDAAILAIAVDDDGKVFAAAGRTILRFSSDGQIDPDYSSELSRLHGIRSGGRLFAQDDGTLIRIFRR